jgi:hypothetical protein
MHRLLAILKEKYKLPEIIQMEKKNFLLGPAETSITVRIIRIIFGSACIVIAVFWMIFNLKSVKPDRSLWITVMFLTGFGMYQIWAGLGRATRFIEISREMIRLKKNSILPERKIRADEIKKIEVFPLNLIIYFHAGNRTILRFGNTYSDITSLIKDEIAQFAQDNNIILDIKNEEF